MLTVKQLLRGKGKYWTDKPSKELSSGYTLLWAACSDLADMVEILIEPEDLPKTWPQTWTVLWGAEDYFRQLGHPLSKSHALILLLVERVNHGLTRRGNDRSGGHSTSGQTQKISGE
jgi:hypothetical protein